MMTQVEPPAASVMPTPLPSTRRKQITRFVRHHGLQFGIVGVLVAMWVFLMITAPRTFLNKEIYISFADSVPYYGIMALPITLLIIAREIDLSFGSIMAVGGMCFLAVFHTTSSPPLGVGASPLGPA